jgi:DNA-binding NarL/FixJ family response regulator
MTLLARLLRLREVVRPQSSGVNLNPELFRQLEQLAVHEQRPVNEVAEELLHTAVTERQAAIEHLYIWMNLTQRERQVAALACIGYTNKEIARQMVISTNTVKAHMRSTLTKFGVNSKVDLRDLLSGWDFTSWLEGQNLFSQSNLTLGD